MFKKALLLLLAILLPATLSHSASLLFGSDLNDSDIDLHQYESRFRPVPDSDDPHWQVVPIEEWEQTFRFIADSANSNLERLTTWSASYKLITRSNWTSLSSSIQSALPQNTSYPSYAIVEQILSFHQDNVKDQSYISLTRLGDIRFFNEKYESIDYSYPVLSTNIRAIVNPGQLLMYEYDQNAMRPDALQQLGHEEFGKKCVVTTPDSGYVSPLGMIFDPRFFYFQALKPRFKYWIYFEHSLPLELRAFLEKSDDTLPERVKIYKGTFEHVDWMRVEYKMKNEDASSVFYFSSESGYNMILSIFTFHGIEKTVNRFEYSKIDEVFIPIKFFIKHANSLDPTDDSKRYFRYLELIKSSVNPSIPDSQFKIDALQLDDDAIILDMTEGNYYEYEKGKEYTVPIAKVDELSNGASTNAHSTPLWRSPIRVTALCLGLCLLVFGVIYKVRRKRASS